MKIFNTNHSFCLETEKGAEIVVHMGIDTVALEGKGFKRLVEEGAQVSAGQPILEMEDVYKRQWWRRDDQAVRRLRGNCGFR